MPFTLIELLVVIAILAILASLLLPGLKKAQESAKRKICLSNMHQIYLGILSYNDDNDNTVPHHWTDPMDGSLATEDCEYASNTTPFTAWRTYEDLRYLTTSLFNCPSQGWAPVLTTNGQGIHYGYRYNSRRVTSYSGDGFTNNVIPRGVLIDPKRNMKVLVTDAARMRRDDAYLVVLTNTGNYYRRRWAHEQGGHMLLHNGAALWLNNRPPNGWPLHWYGGGMWTNLDTQSKNAGY